MVNTDIKKKFFERSVNISAIKYFKLSLWAVVLFWILLTALVAQSKINSIEMHRKDFGYYAQFSAKLSDPKVSKQLSFQPEGTNVFGIGGVEGERSFHQAVHFEPIKYAYSLIYFVFKSPLSIFVFVSLI